MKYARIVTNRDFTVGEVDARLFGSFVEHMGSVVYNGIFEPGHSTAGPDGCREDVLALVKQLHLSVLRYPGGNFSSSYNWEETVGPVEQRPVRLELAWQALEPNTFGLNEFLAWAKQVGAEPMLTINLGTRGIDAARNLVEYCNFPANSAWSDLRAAHGFPEPHGIRLWCLGNEMDGAWQVAAKTAREYGELARETAKVIRLIDPQVELVAAGSSAPHLESYPEWDREVLMQTYEQVDYLSLHNYINKKNDDTPTYLARPMDMERQIQEIISTCDYVKAVKHSTKTMYLAFDEWNVHKHPEIPYTKWTTGSPFDWCRHTMEDTLVFGSMLLAILRHADRVKISCQSLLVNTIPLILTLKNGPAWRNPIYYPLQHASLYGRGTVLQQTATTPSYSTASYTDVPGIDSVVVQNIDEETITIFCVNRMDEATEIRYIHQGYRILHVIEHFALEHPDLSARNTEEAPNTLVPQVKSQSVIQDMFVQTVVDPYSWNVIRMKISV